MEIRLPDLAPVGAQFEIGPGEIAQRLCGCGDKADPIKIPALMVKMAGNKNMMGKMRAMMGFGNGDGTE